MVSNTEILNKLKVINTKVDDLHGALDSVGTDKILAKITDAIPLSSIDIQKIAGTQLTGRDWSLDFEKLQNIDIPISSLARTRVYEQTFEGGTTDTTANNATQTVQSTEVYAGDYALEVTIASGNTGYIETPKRPVSPHQEVTFAYAHKEDTNIEDIKLEVVWYRASGGIISTDEFTLTPSTSWQVDSRTVTAPSKASTMSMRMKGTAGTSDGTYYLDEITIDLVGQIYRVDGQGNIMVAIETEDVDMAKETTLSSILSQLDVALSTRASETTLSEIKGQTDKLTFDASDYLYVNAAIVANPSNLDVLLSTRASESTLNAFSDKFPSAAALSDALGNPTTTIVGSALLGWDSAASNWERIQTDGSGRLKVWLG